ncbi:MAG: 2-oxo acid dehydrogenase subunit E2, partial [Planctomycetes bacterium]|nr:2-oxo acid dehydrogenase subunit E2 [Planctomycetota bacterium]
MATHIKLPQPGQNNDDATIITVDVDRHQMVTKGQKVCEIETDKAVMDIEATESGFVQHIFVAEGQTVPMGKTIMLLGEKDEHTPQSVIDSLVCELKTEPVFSAIDPANSNGSTDIEDDSAEKDDAPVDIYSCKLGDSFTLSKLQKITAKKMLQSKHNIPCFYLNIEADVTDLVSLRGKMNQSCEPKVSYNDFIIKALCSSLEHFPIMTGQIKGRKIVTAENIGIALAIETALGLVTVVVENASQMSVQQIAAKTKGLIEKAKNNKLSLKNISGACITVSNLGFFEVESFIPIVVPG